MTMLRMVASYTLTVGGVLPANWKHAQLCRAHGHDDRCRLTLNARLEIDGQVCQADGKLSTK